MRVTGSGPSTASPLALSSSLSFPLHNTHTTCKAGSSYIQSGSRRRPIYARVCVCWVARSGLAERRRRPASLLLLHTDQLSLEMLLQPLLLLQQQHTHCRNIPSAEFSLRSVESCCCCCRLLYRARAPPSTSCQRPPRRSSHARAAADSVHTTTENRENSSVTVFVELRHTGSARP